MASPYYTVEVNKTANWDLNGKVKIISKPYKTQKTFMKEALSTSQGYRLRQTSQRFFQDGLKIIGIPDTN